jgi:serine protease Do
MPDPRQGTFIGHSAHLRILWALMAGLIGSPCALADTDSRMTPIVRAVRDASPSVVNIQGQKSIQESGARGPSRQVNGMGTGIVIDPRGYILTNHHVVDGVRQINVTLNTGQTYVAQIVGRDRETDLAVIRIRTKHSLPIIKIGTSDDLLAGETVIAVGNAYGYENTVTKGIISALHRNVQVNETQKYLDLIQTDASINPGNSGGPLLNIDGEMIGVNVAVRAGAQGIGFAIPVNKSFEIATQILSIERLDNHWHGISTVLLQGPQGPVTVGQVARNSPAAEVGLQKGDQIERIGTLAIHHPIDVERALLGRSTGDQVPLIIRRNDDSMELEIVITTKADHSQVASGQPASLQPNNALQQATWDSFGLILKPESRTRFRQMGLAYSGGMRVVAVRRGSSADLEGIRKNDYLVKVHRWTMVDNQDLRNLIRRQNAVSQLGMVKFYIVRGKETFYGHMVIASHSEKSRR